MTWEVVDLCSSLGFLEVAGSSEKIRCPLSLLLTTKDLADVWRDAISRFIVHVRHIEAECGGIHGLRCRILGNDLISGNR